MVVCAISQNLILGLLYIVAAGAAFILIVIGWRVTMELLMTLFKIEENTRKIDLAVEAEVTEAVEAEANQEQSAPE